MLKKRTEFLYITTPAKYNEIFELGITEFSKNLVYKRKKANKFGFGIIVSKKVGNSVIRHKIKRTIRAGILEKEKIWEIKEEIVFIVKKRAGENKDEIKRIPNEIYKKLLFSERK